MGLELERHRLEEPAEPPLAGRVGRGAGLPRPRSERADADDGPAPARDQSRNGVLEGEERSLEVQIEEQIPHLLGRLVDRGPLPGAGVQDDDVEASPLLERLPDGALDLPGIGDVGRNGERSRTRCREVRDRAAEFGSRASEAGDRASLGDECLGDREAEAPARAGDERDLASQARRGTHPPTARDGWYSRPERSSNGRSQGRPSTWR